MRAREVFCGLYLKLVPGAVPSNLVVPAGDAELQFCDVKLGEVSLQIN